jgi:Mrp family chromosome partitioning ATPase/capsular polysaccharide biosynthesis protein
VDLDKRPTESIDLRELLRPLRSRWWLILALVATATAGTYLYYASKPKRYTASTELLIRASEADAGFSSSDASRTAKDLVRLLKSSPVVEQVQRDAGVSGQVSASASTDSDFVTVTATAGSPNHAARLAHAYADALVASRRGQLRKDTEEALITARRDLALLPAGRVKADSRSALRSRINNLEAALTVPGAGAERVGQARPPSGSSAPRPERNAAFAFLLSLMLGVAAAYALAWLDRRIRHVEEVERVFGLNLIGVVPHAAPASERGGRYPTADQFFREAFRTLLTNIQCSSLDHPPGTVLVTSALPAEGKSTVVHNLALASRDSGLRVAVVESDLHAPSLATMFRVQTAPGLMNVLSGGADLGDALQRVTADTPAATEVELATVMAAANGDSAAVSDGSISVLTSGSVTANPPALLATERVTSLFDQIAAEYDLTLIDSSPLLTVSDSVPLLSLADATILVCRVGLATVPAVRRVTEILQRQPRANILGVVANDVPTEEFERRYADYYGTA